MRDWVLAVLEGSSRNKGSIRDYKILRNKFGTSIFRETGLNLSIRRAYGSIRRAYGGLTLVPCHWGETMGISRGREEPDLVQWGAYTAR